MEPRCPNSIARSRLDCGACIVTGSGVAGA